MEKRASGENGVVVAGRDCGSDGTVGQTDEQEVEAAKKAIEGNNVDRNPELDIGVLRWLLNTEVSLSGGPFL